MLKLILYTKQTFVAEDYFTVQANLDNISIVVLNCGYELYKAK